MKLLGRELRAQLPALHSQERIEDPTVVAKYFAPWCNWLWYAIEFDGEDTFFGLVVGHEAHLKRFSLSSLARLRGPFGQMVERDLNWEPKPLSEVRKLHPDGPLYGS